MAKTKYTRLISNKNKVLNQWNANVSASLSAVGLKCVSLINKEMKTGFGKPIRITGDLMRDVNYQVIGNEKIRVGNSLEYAKFVHEGTSKKDARPYISQALKNGIDSIARVYVNCLRKGFK